MPKATSPSSYSRCRTLLAGVDAIIVNPVDTNAVKPIMDQATKAGIPLILLTAARRRS